MIYVKTPDGIELNVEKHKEINAFNVYFGEIKWVAAMSHFGILVKEFKTFYDVLPTALKT